MCVGLLDGVALGLAEGLLEGLGLGLALGLELGVNVPEGDGLGVLGTGSPSEESSVQAKQLYHFRDLPQ